MAQSRRSSLKTTEPCGYTGSRRRKWWTTRVRSFGLTRCWTNGINPNSTSDQSSLIGSLASLTPVVRVAANATLYYFPEFSVYSLLGFMPTYWSILVYNQSGSAFDLTAANFYAKHSLVSYA